MAERNLHASWIYKESNSTAISSPTFAGLCQDETGQYSSSGERRSGAAAAGGPRNEVHHAEPGGADEQTGIQHRCPGKLHSDGLTLRFDPIEFRNALRAGALFV